MRPDLIVSCLCVVSADLPKILGTGLHEGWGGKPRGCLTLVWQVATGNPAALFTPDVAS